MFTFLETLFALGTFWFWLLFLIDFVVITALVENEEGAWATIVAIGSIVGLNYLWKLPIIATIKTNPGHVALLVLSYFVIGAAWSFVKWYFFLHKANGRYLDYKAKFLERKNVSVLDGQLAAILMDELAENNNRYLDAELRISAEPPVARKHKARLTRWATYWPFSMVGFALNDVVRKTWTYIYEMLQGAYQRVSNHVFRNTSADVAIAQEYKSKAAAAGADDGSRSSTADSFNPTGRGRAK